MGLLRNLAARGLTDYKADTRPVVQKLAAGGFDQGGVPRAPKQQTPSTPPKQSRAPEAKQRGPYVPNPDVIQDWPSQGLSIARPIQAAPGSVATNIKTNGPTQAEQIAAGYEANNTAKHLSDSERLLYGDKDMRSRVAERKLQLANELTGGDLDTRSIPDRDVLVDMLNQPGAQTGVLMQQAVDSDAFINQQRSMGAAGEFARAPYESRNFIGEGQFGRVSELAPGYVIKEQAPLVEWGGFKDLERDPSGVRGEDIGKIFDHRDVEKEVYVTNYLNKAHITPKVQQYNLNPDGSTETIMGDLRENYTLGKDYEKQMGEALQNASTPEEFAQLLAKARITEVKNKQQEGIAISKDVKIGDRHPGNYYVHKITGRPLQVDLGMTQSLKVPDGTGKYVRNEGARDFYMAENAIAGMRAGGFTEEADIFDMYFERAIDRNNGTIVDPELLHDLSRSSHKILMKMKKAAPENYKRVRPQEDYLGLDDLFADDYSIDYAQYDTTAPTGY